MLWSAPNKGTGRENHSYPDYADFREQARSFSSLALYTQAAAVLNTGSEPRELQGLAATSDLFQVLRTVPVLGRAYTRAEDSPNARVVVISHEAWQRYFNADPNIIERQVRLALKPYTVIGVMPRGFRFPIGVESEFLTPIYPLDPTAMQNRGAHFPACSWPPATRCDSGPGEYRDGRHRRTSRKAISGHEHRSQCEGRSLASGFSRRRALSAARRPGCSVPGFANRLRKCRQPAPRPRDCALAGDRDPDGAGREPRSHR
jgi:hypothetical protein